MPDTPEERAEATQVGTFRRKLLANPHDRDVPASPLPVICLLYTSDAADEQQDV